LVVCEGEVTEPEYLDGLQRVLRIPRALLQIVVVGAGKGPMGVVRAAAGAYADHDEVWCVMDVDQHADLDKALAEARRRRFKVVVSSPSFELWLLYHFQDLNSGTDQDHLREKLRRYVAGYDKHLPPDFPFDQIEAAKARALRADPELVEVNRRGRNPSTSVWLLTDSIQSNTPGSRGRARG
jgi:hypothetical protein